MGRAKVNVPDYMKYVDFGYERPGQDVRYSISCNYLKDNTVGVLQKYLILRFKAL